MRSFHISLMNHVDDFMPQLPHCLNICLLCVQVARREHGPQFATHLYFYPHRLHMELEVQIIYFIKNSPHVKSDTNLLEPSILSQEENMGMEKCPLRARSSENGSYDSVDIHSYFMRKLRLRDKFKGCH